MAVHFRCSHDRRDSDPNAFESRLDRLAASRTLYEVPEDADWEPVRDIRPSDHGPEFYDVGTHKTTVTCPDCGAESVIVTDQDVTE